VCVFVCLRVFVFMCMCVSVCVCVCVCVCQDNVDNVAACYDLEGREIESRWGDFFTPVYTGPVAHSASYKEGIRSFLTVNRPRCGVYTQGHLE